jgi:hypothetical protein
MFVAKFTPTAQAPFVSDKNGNFPFIGTVVAGTASAAIMNGTMFKREALEPNVLYLCDNHVDPLYPDNAQTTVIAKVSITEFMELRTSLGAGKLVRNEVGAEAIGAEA